MDRVFSVETALSLLIIAVAFFAMVCFDLWHNYRRQKKALAIAHQTLMVFARENPALARELLIGWTGSTFAHVYREAVEARFNAYKAEE